MPLWVVVADATTTDTWVEPKDASSWVLLAQGLVVASGKAMALVAPWVAMTDATAGGSDLVVKFAVLGVVVVMALVVVVLVLVVWLEVNTVVDQVVALELVVLEERVEAEMVVVQVVELVQQLELVVLDERLEPVGLVDRVVVMELAAIAALLDVVGMVKLGVLRLVGMRGDAQNDLVLVVLALVAVVSPVWATR